MKSDDVPPPEMTPEELRKVYDYYRSRFTVEDLIEYIEDDVPKYPLADVIAEAEAMIEEMDRRDRGEAA